MVPLRNSPLVKRDETIQRIFKIEYLMPSAKKLGLRVSYSICINILNILRLPVGVEHSGFQNKGFAYLKEILS